MINVGLWYFVRLVSMCRPLMVDPDSMRILDRVPDIEIVLRQLLRV